MSCAAFLCGFFIELGTSIHENKSAFVNGDQITVTQGGDCYHGAIALYDAPKQRNPYGVVLIGNEWRPSPKLAITLAYRHESSMVTNIDRGVDAVQFSIRWNPFRG